MATTFKSAVLESKLTINQELGGAHVDGQKVVTDDLNETLVIDSGSSPDGAYAFNAHLAMTGSAVTIDLLDALVDLEGNTITMTAQKVRAIKFRNPSTANTVTITGGATNANLIFGTAGSIILGVGASVLLYLADSGVVIDATHCNIDATGTNGQYLDYALVCG
jgi:hypothetical protein